MLCNCFELNFRVDKWVSLFGVYVFRDRDIWIVSAVFKITSAMVKFTCKVNLYAVAKSCSIAANVGFDWKKHEMAWKWDFFVERLCEQYSGVCRINVRKVDAVHLRLSGYVERMTNVRLVKVVYDGELNVTRLRGHPRFISFWF